MNSSTRDYRQYWQPVLVLLILCVVWQHPAIAQGSAQGKVTLTSLCQSIAGQWQGSAANPEGRPMQVSTQAVCSSDAKQLMITVSRSSRFNSSEVWWFRQQPQGIKLLYSNGIEADVIQHFSLYQRGQRYSMVGKGDINQRPALIQLVFTYQPANATADPSSSQQAYSSSQQVSGNKGRWLWQQSAHYLDDDSSEYTVVRSIDMHPLETIAD